MSYKLRRLENPERKTLQTTTFDLGIRVHLESKSVIIYLGKIAFYLYSPKSQEKIWAKERGNK